MKNVFDIKKFEEIEKAQVNFFPDYKKLLDESMVKKIDEVTNKIVSIFKHYIKGIYISGSFVTGLKKEKLSDLDFFVIVDDTDVQKMSRTQVWETLFAQVNTMAREILKVAHVQIFLLTEWWRNITMGEPTMFHSLLTGAIVYQSEDCFLETFKRLLAKGKIKKSEEVIDTLIFAAKEWIRLAKESLPLRVIYNLEQALLHVSEALLVELGYRGDELSAILRSTIPIETSKEALENIRKNLYEREKLISEDDVKLIERLIELREEGEKTGDVKISGKELDELLKKSEEYFKRILEIIKKLREERGEKWMFEELLKKEEIEFKKKAREGLVALEETYGGNDGKNI